MEAGFQSHYPIERLELVVNGVVVQGWEWEEGHKEGQLRHQFETESDGWVAARLWGRARDSFGHSLYAHSSPIYLHSGIAPSERMDAARFFLDAIDTSLDWIDSVGRYSNDEQRENVRELFHRGREVYAGLRRG